MIGRSDGRLGQPEPTGEPLDHICPICDGQGSSPAIECYCNGLGVITARQAAELAADDPDPRWAPRPLPPVPQYTGKRCHDCAFRPDSPERDRAASAEELFEQLELGNDGGPFWCHVGMHHGAQGYVPRQRDKYGAPIGHPICAGWVRQYERRLQRSEDDSYPYVWRVRTRLPERFGQRCRVLARGALNTCHVQFEDGTEVFTSRNYLRRATQP